MSKRNIGEFKVSGFAIGIASSLVMALALYYVLSSRIEPPKEQELNASVDSLLKRTQDLEKQTATDRLRIDYLEKEVAMPRTSREPPGQQGKKPGKPLQ